MHDDIFGGRWLCSGSDRPPGINRGATADLRDADLRELLSVREQLRYTLPCGQ